MDNKDNGNDLGFRILAGFIVFMAFGGFLLIIPIINAFKPDRPYYPPSSYSSSDTFVDVDDYGRDHFCSHRTESCD